MGSHTDGWLACKACGFDTKCSILPNSVFCLIDNEDSGMMCNPCYKSLSSAYPQLTLWWFEDKLPSPVAKMIERMAYPDWDTKDRKTDRPFRCIRGSGVYIRGGGVCIGQSLEGTSLTKVMGVFLGSSGEVIRSAQLSDGAVEFCRSFAGGRHSAFPA